MSEIKQGLGEEIDENGNVHRYFFDHFGDDFDLYICRAFDPWEVEPPPENPEAFEQMMNLLLDGDDMEPAEHVRLVDLSSDGMPVLESEEDDDEENDDEHLQ